MHVSKGDSLHATVHVSHNGDETPSVHVIHGSSGHGTLHISGESLKRLKFFYLTSLLTFNNSSIPTE